MRWRAGLLMGLVAWSGLLGAVAGAQEPLTLTVTTNRTDFAAGDHLQVTVGVDNAGLPGTSADFFVGVVLPDGSTVVAFGPGGATGVGTLASLATLPAFARGVSLAGPFSLPAQPVLDYQWTGSEPPGQYLLFAAAVRAGGLADGSLGPVDLLTLSTRTLRLEAGGGGADWHAFADSRPVDRASDILSYLQAAPADLCAAAPASPPALPEALARLAAGLQQLAGPQALDGFLASLPGVSRLPALAAAALADRKPHAALAALLVASQSDPQNPSHLVNAAGLASLLGFPAEALSLLAAADQLGPDASSPLGIPGRALAQNNRGHALLGLGRWAEAEAALQEAIDLAPRLAEARANLSLAVLCQGVESAPDRATRLFRASQWRTPGLPLVLDAGVQEPPADSPATRVTIHAIQPTATEAPPAAGLLTITRIGDPSAALTVGYQVSGTATPDTDYVALPGSVTIPAGVFAVDIPVLPTRDEVADPDETVVVTLAAGPGYAVGSASSATVTIGDVILPAGRFRRATLPLAPDAIFEIPEVWDLSLGQEGSLPTLPYLEIPEQVTKLIPIYQAIDQVQSERADERNARSQQVRDQLIARPALPLLRMFRIHDTITAMYSYGAEPGLHPLVAELEAAQGAVDAILNELQRTLSGNQKPLSDARAACLGQANYNACVQQATTQYACEPIRSNFHRWRPAIARLDTAVHRLWGPASRYMTALAANIADPLYHEQAMIDAVEWGGDILFYTLLFGRAQSYVDTVNLYFRFPGPHGCGGGAAPTPDNPGGTPQVTDPGACPPALTAAKVQIKFLEVIAVSFNCETVELEVSEPGLGFFTQIGFTRRPRQNLEATFFVGAKASVPLTGLSAKEGFFLTADSTQVRDLGFKVSMSNVLGGPAGGLKVDSPTNMEFGVAAASQYWFDR